MEVVLLVDVFGFEVKRNLGIAAAQFLDLNDQPSIWRLNGGKSGLMVLTPLR